MNKWISNFSSRVFYDEKLKAHKSIENRRIRYRSSAFNKAESIQTTPDIERALDPRYPLVFLDIRDEVVADVKQSNAEARTVRELVRVLLARGIQPQEIGVIAPYRAQVANIRRHLFQADGTTGWEGLPSDTPLSVDTVDRFQGGERLVIIMSFATTQEPPQDSPRRDFLTNPNRLNVALTRAQCKLILIGCVPALQNLPTFSRLLTYCRSMHTIIEAQAGKQLTQVEILN
jgi:DNA replication ATP-dependent helicase Dna2